MEKTVGSDNDVTPYKKCAVEIQAFRNNQDRFIIKELVFLDLSTHVLNYFLFKPPFPFKLLNSKSARTNVWLAKNLHYIGWDEGFTHYKELNNIMNHYCQQYDEIYTCGNEKSTWIQKYCDSKVINLTLDKTFATTFNGLCIGVKNPQHKMSCCAMSRAYRIGYMVSCGGGNGYISL